jgi:hypothetical protein
VLREIRAANVQYLEGTLQSDTRKTYSAIETMLSRDFPTEVPPNFWTTHGALASNELLLRRDAVDEDRPVGVEAPDRLGCIVSDGFWLV